MMHGQTKIKLSQGILNPNMKAYYPLSNSHAVNNKLSLRQMLPFKFPTFYPYPSMFCYFFRTCTQVFSFL